MDTQKERGQHLKSATEEEIPRSEDWNPEGSFHIASLAGIYYLK